MIFLISSKRYNYLLQPLKAFQ